MANGRTRKRKKVRYSEVRIRLSFKQKRSLINYCHARKTTPNKLIKKMSPCYEKDLRTFHLIEHILSEEIEHEEAFENLMTKKRK